MITDIYADFKFDKHVLWDSPDMTFIKIFQKGGIPRATFPL